MKKIKIALAGNPNAGKTSIFNALTGAHQKVGNWPGVTVERKEGYFEHNGFKIEVVDLPGIYSLSASSIDEKIARDFLLKENPDVVVCIVDSSNFERNLFLVLELLEMGQNVVIDLNMSDIAEKEGVFIDAHKLSLVFGKLVVKTVANKGKGIKELKDAIVFAYLSKTQSMNCDTCPLASLCPYKKACPYSGEGSFSIRYDEKVENAIEEVVEYLKKNKVQGNLRWFAIKLLEGDPYVIDLVKNKYSVKDIEDFILPLVSELENHLDEEILGYIVENKYGVIRGILLETVRRKAKVKPQGNFLLELTGLL